MKKLLSVFSILLLIGFSANQVAAQTGFGVRGGVNFANLNDTDADVDARTGIMAGAYLNLPISNSPVSIQPEVLYTQKGFESGDNTYQLDYVEVPVLARFDFITNSGLRPHVYFGPYIGFNVNAEIDGEDEGTLFPDDSQTNIDDITNDTDFGVSVGAGLDFGRFDLGVRYNAGLTEVFDADDMTAKNGVLSIVGGIGF